MVQQSSRQVTHLSTATFLFWTLQMTVVCFKVNYLPGGVRIWFHPNCRVGVFGDMANLSSEIGYKWPKKGLKIVVFFGGGLTYDK